ncbi:MAG: hypothetical protein FVQ83_05865 [Chloroflexi bacterium]|nr:hypothetical protein [Chloroflexota bacterium]
MTNSDDEIELKTIWNKWCYIEATKRIEQKIEVLCDEFRNITWDLQNQCFDLGVFDRKKSYHFGKEIGKRMGYLSRGAFLSGVDYGMTNPQISNIDFNSLPDTTIGILIESKKPIHLHIGGLVGLIYKHMGKTTDEIIQKVQEYDIPLIKTSYSCFSVGFEHSFSIR